MAVIAQFSGGSTYTESLRVGTYETAMPRSNLLQDALAAFVIPWSAWRVWNAYQTTLPGTSSSDDLGLYGGTWGSDTPSIQTYDVKAQGALSIYARAMLWLPPEYDAGETINLRFKAGMLTHVADTSCTIDAECYKSNNESLVSGSDLVTTAATTINSLTLANKDFAVTASGLVPGDVLDLRIKIAVTDSAGVTPVYGCIGYAALLLDIRG